MLLIEPETGSIIDANVAAAVFYGYTHEALCRMRIGDLTLPPPGSPRIGGDPIPIRDSSLSVHRLAGGETRIVALHSTPVQVGGRQLLFAIPYDVTDREQARER
jgi:PAS domain S-box-containing protein